jgi:hypothetical protein
MSHPDDVRGWRHADNTTTNCQHVHCVVAAVRTGRTGHRGTHAGALTKRAVTAVQTNSLAVILRRLDGAPLQWPYAPVAHDFSALRARVMSRVSCRRRTRRCWFLAGCGGLRWLSAPALQPLDAPHARTAVSRVTRLSSRRPIAAKITAASHRGTPLASALAWLEFTGFS